MPGTCRTEPAKRQRDIEAVTSVFPSPGKVLSDNRLPRQLVQNNRLHFWTWCGFLCTEGLTVCRRGKARIRTSPLKTVKPRRAERELGWSSELFFPLDRISM